MASDPERLQHALRVAYSYLSRRERTTKEVRKQLEQKAVGPAVVDEAIAILGEDGYLDDARFARLFLQDKRELEQWGTERIRQRLMARGLERDVIDAAIAEGQASCRPGQPGSELERALSVLRRRFPSPPQNRRERDRALGALIRKGYDPDLALEALAAHARGGGLDD